MKRIFLISALIPFFLSAPFSREVTAVQDEVKGVGMSLDIEYVAAKKVARRFNYAVKFLCGTVRSDVDPQLPGPEQLLAPGTYLTQINIYNPGASAVTFTKKAIILTPGLVTGPSGRPATVRLDTMQGLKVGCEEIANLAGRRLSIPEQFIEGFVAIDAPAELDVVAVYTAKNVETFPRR